jgi:mitochondrial fission protein ELM1
MSETTVPPSSQGDPRRPARPSDVLECVVLPRRPGAQPSDRPPVEIFLGTEPAQYRANRVLGWSIEKVRDPGREVRLYLMSELDGFDRRAWTTGFTNYRFAIPAYQGGRGRAIYNDEDQIYLTDPGRLFDLDLGEAGHLSISDTESSVMLIDCEKMSRVWSLDAAQHRWKRALLRKATKPTGLRGDLDPGWNARDEEFVPGESHLLHYTTLHTQPWRPFPERFVYQAGFHTDLWHELEAEAIENGFEFFRHDAPSRGFQDRLTRQRALARSELNSGVGAGGELADSIEALTKKTGSRTLLELLPDLNGEGQERPGRFGLEVERRLGLVEWLDRSASEPGVSSDANIADGVICVDGLEAFPSWDIPWLIDALFRSASRFVFVSVRCSELPPRRRFLLPPQGTTHTPEWWRSHFEAASIRHPQVRWELMTARGASFDSERIHVCRGGSRPDASPPKVWTLTDGEPDNETPAAALASVLGWPSLAVRLEGDGAKWRPGAGLGAHLRALRSDDPARAVIQPPWPDLLIVAGRRAAPLARWIRQAAHGRTQVVAIGPEAATPADQVDLAVTPKQAGLFPHPQRLEIDRPLVLPASHWPVSPKWRECLAGINGPRLVLLLGCDPRRRRLEDREAEAIGKRAAESAAALGASILVLVGRDCPERVRLACLGGAGEVAIVHQETADESPDEPAWPAFLAAAEAFIDLDSSESRLAEICETGRPVFLAAERPIRTSLGMRIRNRIRQAVGARAEARPANDRGTTRPQQGLELLCARWIEKGWVGPRRDRTSLGERLVRSGHARLLAAPIQTEELAGFPSPLEPELPIVAAVVRRMMGAAKDDSLGRGKRE